MKTEPDHASRQVATQAADKLGRGRGHGVWMFMSVSVKMWTGDDAPQSRAPVARITPLLGARGYRASASRRSRTAHLRTSGEDLFVVLLMMLHPYVFKVGHTEKAGGSPFHPGKADPAH